MTRRKCARRIPDTLPDSVQVVSPSEKIRITRQTDIAPSGGVSFFVVNGQAACSRDALRRSSASERTARYLPRLAIRRHRSLMENSQPRTENCAEPSRLSHPAPTTHEIGFRQRACVYTRRRRQIVPEKGGFPDNSASDSLLPVCLGSRRQLSETSFVKTHISEEHFS